MAFCVLLDNADVIKYIGEEGGPSVFYFLFFSISYGGLFGRYLLPVMSALPAGTMFVEDYEHHFLPYMVARTGKKTYLVSKYCVSILLGGVTMVLGMLLLISLLSSVCPPISADELDAVSYYVKQVSTENGVPYYGYTLYFAFLAGCLWSGLAVAVSAFVRSQSFTLAVPFVGSFLLTQGLKMVRLPDAYRLDMWLYMRSTLQSERFTMMLTASHVGIILMIAGLAFIRKGRGLIENA